MSIKIKHLSATIKIIKFPLSHRAKCVMIIAFHNHNGIEWNDMLRIFTALRLP